MLIVLFLILLYFYISFFKTGINQINNYVKMEMEKYHYNIEEKETTNNGDDYNKKNNEI